MGEAREMDTEQRKGILSREKREGDTESGQQRAVRAACVKKRERERGGKLVSLGSK